MKNRNLLLVLIAIGFIAFYGGLDMLKIGKTLDSYQGVPIYHNGMLLNKVHGKNYSSEGYFYGLKWQCVEFVQRFYYDVLGHKMLDPTKNAKDYFSAKLGEGKVNPVTGLRQYANGEGVKPKVKDIIVFHGGKYGHVAIVSQVGPDYIEIVQQNVYGKPRERLPLLKENNNYIVKSENLLVGWLRK